MSETEWDFISEILFVLLIPIKIIIFFLFVRLCCDIHNLKEKWVNQVRFEDGTASLDK